MESCRQFLSAYSTGYSLLFRYYRTNQLAVHNRPRSRRAAREGYPPTIAVHFPPLIRGIAQPLLHLCRVLWSSACWYCIVLFSDLPRKKKMKIYNSTQNDGRPVYGFISNFQQFPNLMQRIFNIMGSSSSTSRGSRSSNSGTYPASRNRRSSTGASSNTRSTPSSTSASRRTSSSAGGVVQGSSVGGASTTGGGGPSSTGVTTLSRPGAYSISREGAGPTQVFRVQIPHEIRPGQEFQVREVVLIGIRACVDEREL